jgi:hypothetical protein
VAYHPTHPRSKPAGSLFFSSPPECVSLFASAALRHAPDCRITPTHVNARGPMRARIYQPARTAMSSGTAKTKHWVLEFASETARGIDPLMGWTSSTDTQTQVS